ncbi:MAG: rhodanese-like domain-containing protein [Leptolyngbyaceae cyanobacterium bins.349]|nr:rhodanese-like domain-containing protein [Leptolyngbyaceae cyanobacterium bins.349]
MSKLSELFIIPKAIQDRSPVDALKNRLDWGEPALTIVDVRERSAFNTKHIMGAIAMPLHELVERAQTSLELNRDIYVYGETDEQTTDAASRLRDAGYEHVSELIGGLTAWDSANYPVEG